jgi:uncharacterized protein
LEQGLSSASISALELLGNVPGKGEFVGRIYKHLSPVTIAALERALPLDGRVNFYDSNFAYILTGVVVGEEKSRKEFKKGEIAFMPAGSMICFFLKDTRSYKPMNALGQLVSGMEVLEKCKRGDSIRIEKISALSGGGG